jgi:hypothetical protein
MARKLSVSKGLYLKSIVSQSGTNYPMVVRVEQENLPHKIRLLGNIHLYVWLATCDLTSKTKGGAVSFNPIDAGHIRAIPNPGTETNYFFPVANWTTDF